MHNPSLKTEYEGTQLAIVLTEDTKAMLLVNGVSRDILDLPSGEVWGLRLNSTVQTGYEWHEFIEGRLQYKDGQITAQIFANSREIAKGCLNR